jgi:selenium metabolism protein YedF
MRIVDTKGHLCPVPLIETKKALKETVVGESFAVLTDNKTSLDNLSRFLKDNRADFRVTENDGIWTLTITKSEDSNSPAKAEDYCNTPIAQFEKGDFIISISSEKMGEGDEVLGHLLMLNFIKAVKDLDRLPQTIVFYNSGVKLATISSPVIEHLRDLEKMGVELLCCATCVNHYSLQSVVSAGTLSNMYAIAEVMSRSGKIIKP